MAIKAGDKLPNVTFYVMTSDGPKPKTTDEVFKGKKVALFAVPGAFTPTCTNMHMPSFVKNTDAIKAKGVKDIVVTSTNDVFVLREWLKSTGAEGKVEALSDGNAQFAKAIGMDFDGSGRGLGTRTKRYSMLVDDGVVKTLNLEEQPGQCTISGGETLLKQL
ncbi:MAG: peroxiredoxin [Pseudolabrys sp.]|nr:peroxiredoxin [Pseudolabrys sp.]MBV9260368.1 peroxiredoxin [Pseudolabrys sp.]